MRDDGDKLYYLMWGLTFVMGSIGGIMWILGFRSEALLTFFVILGLSLSILGKKDPYKFYTGLGLMLVGVIMYSFIDNLNMSYVVIGITIVIGTLIMWYGFGGDKIERPSRES